MQLRAWPALHSYHHLPHTHGQQGPASWVPPKPEKALRCWLAGFVNLSALSHEPTKTAPGPRPRRWKDSKHLKETGKCSFLQSGQQSRFIPTHFPSQDHSSQQRALCTSNRANGVYLQAQHRPVSHPASASVVKQRNSRRRSRAGPEGLGARGAKIRPSPTASTLSACRAYKSLKSVSDHDQRTAASVRACTTTFTATASQ